MKDNEGPANVEEGVSVHVEEDGEDLVVGQAAQSSRIQVSHGKPTDVTLKKVEYDMNIRRGIACIFRGPHIMSLNTNIFQCTCFSPLLAMICSVICFWMSAMLGVLSR